MPRRVIPYRISNFTGENNRDGLTNQQIYGMNPRGTRLYRCRGMHIIGPGRLLTRRGYKSLIATQVNGSNPVQGLFFYETGSARYLIVVCDGQIKYTTGALGSWTPATGSVSLTGNQDYLHRFSTWQSNELLYVCGTDNVGQPWSLVPGTSAATGLPITGGIAPTRCTDMQEFHGHYLVLAPENDTTLLEATTYGSMDFGDPTVIQTTKNSKGIALAKPNRDVILAFYEDQIWRIQYNIGAGATLVAFPMEGSEPAVSRTSIVTSRGYTYYVGNRGPYRIGSPRQPAEYIGHDIEEFWEECNKSRRKYVTAFVRGAPWSEVVFHVSYGTSTVHNAYLIWNEDYEGWSIIPASVFADVLQFNCGTNWRDTDSIDHTIMGGYDGMVWKAWGAAYSDTGYADNGSHIYWELCTGFMNFGYDGLKGNRELYLDLDIVDDHTINVVLETLGGKPTITKTLSVSGSGDMLDVDFMLDESYLQESTLTFGKTKLEARSRYFQTKLSETGNKAPLVISSLAWPHIRIGTGLR